MSDEDDEETPAVELGEGKSVEGAPLARVTSRLTWPQQKSEVVRKEGESVIRTAEGPRSIEEVLSEIEMTYFASRREFTEAVESVVGTGPVPTE
jgi:hypothetical protein